MYLETHCNIGSKRAFPTGLVYRWHNCWLLYVFSLWRVFMQFKNWLILNVLIFHLVKVYTEVKIILWNLSVVTTPYHEKGVIILIFAIFYFCQMLSNFPNSFTDRLGSKFVVNRYLIIPQTRRYIHYLHMSVRKNSHAPALNGANCYARQSHSKQLLKIFIQ